MNITSTLIIVSFLSLAACTEPKIEVAHDSTAADTQPISMPADTSTPPPDTPTNDPMPSPAFMRVGATATFRETATGLEAMIPFSYTNHASDSVYLTNCNGDVSPSLDQLTDDTWVHWWGPTMNECLSQPVVIVPDATYNDTLHLIVTKADAVRYETLRAPTGPRTYRLHWPQALSTYDSRKYPFGKQVPIEQRTSNPFTITKE